MNNRRSFFKSLIGLIVAPKVAEALPATSPHQMIGYKCSDFVPVVYAPYIPLFKTPHILAKDLINVQPLDASVGSVYYTPHKIYTKRELV